MGDLIDTREARGVDAERLRHVRSLMSRRLAAGHGDQGFSSLVEELRQQSSHPDEEPRDLSNTGSRDARSRLAPPR